VGIITRGLKKLGLDEAIAFTIFSRAIQAGGGIFTLIFVAKNLSTNEQGYYFTFGSILAIQIFFELGLSNIITQFVAHENAHLTWIDKYTFKGPLDSISRLSSLLQFSIKWFSIIGVLLLVGLLIIGNLFFSRYGMSNQAVSWHTPWYLLSFTTVLSFIISPVMAFFEGLGKVKEVAKVRFVQQIIQLFFILFFLSLGLKLLSSPLASILSFLFILIWVLKKKTRDLLLFIWSKKNKWQVNYKNEIFPLQWKIALSWISGYFIFQLFNPVLFATEGPSVAGQMGMTLAVLNAILMLTLSWINTKVPVFSGLIARMEYDKLDHLFNKTLRQSVCINLFALFTFLFGIFFFRYYDIIIGGKKIGELFLPYLPMVAIMIPIFINNIISAWATYLRCHKKEPMLLQSIVIAILCYLSIIYFGKYFGVLGLSIGYLAVSIISFIWAYFIFVTKKAQWH
jgi:O-antigen/teichoic acid export membrane protein